MQNVDSTIGRRPSRVPWNKGKLIGAKPPLRAKHVWSIRTKLQVEGRTRDLAMFNLAIDSKLRGCDVVSLRVEDVAPHGQAVDRATVRQKKTGQPVRFELTEQTREAVDAYIKAAGKKPGQLLFASRRGSGMAMSTRQYARQRSSTAGPEISVPFNCFWATGSRVPFGISALRLTTLWPLRSRSTSEVPGQSRPALPIRSGRVCARKRLMRCNMIPEA